MVKYRSIIVLDFLGFFGFSMDILNIYSSFHKFLFSYEYSKNKNLSFNNTHPYISRQRPVAPRDAIPASLKV